MIYYRLLSTKNHRKYNIFFWDGKVFAVFFAFLTKFKRLGCMFRGCHTSKNRRQQRRVERMEGISLVEIPSMYFFRFPVVRLFLLCRLNDLPDYRSERTTEERTNDEYPYILQGIATLKQCRTK